MRKSVPRQIWISRIWAAGQLLMFFLQNDYAARRGLSWPSHEMSRPHSRLCASWGSLGGADLGRRLGMNNVRKDSLL